MPTDQTPKQLISQRIKDASNILVTVSRDPSVDELSAALALTLLLDKMDKVATAVVSGKMPPAIEFLEPGKTFDSNVDGLRDFIIALDKSKADRLRYKVEDDVVRVFITPYKTTITEDDLTFSQGDFNVDLVVAFGVDKREDLDTAITAHGRILHDATVVTIDQIPGSGSLGEVDWSDTEASSLSEMLMSLTESLQPGVIDEPIATAILTGLVSATDRFRNDKTTPKVMTMAAQLMAAGANQQLIAEKLDEAETVTAEVQSAGTTDKKNDDGVMKVDHDESSEKKDDQKSAENGQKILQDGNEQPKSSGKDALTKKAEQVAEASSAEAVAVAEKELAAVTPPAPAETVSKISQTKGSSWRDTPMATPSTGGTLNATTDSAEEAKRQAAEDDKNRVILSHDTPPAEEAALANQALPPVLNATTLPSHEPTVKDIFATPPNPETRAVPDAPAPEVPPAVAEMPVTAAPSGLNFEETPVATPEAASPNPTLAELEAEVNRQAESAVPDAAGTVDSARAAVDAVFSNQPFNPSGEPLAAAGSQPLGDISHEAPQAPVVENPQTPQAIAPSIDSSVTLPPPPPIPTDFTALPPMPPTIQPPVDTVVPDAEPPLPAAPTFGLPEQQVIPASAPTTAPATQSDLSQFKLPGQ